MMAMKITVGDANVLGDCYEQFGHFEAKFFRLPKPGEITMVNVPTGFYWHIDPPDIIKVYPGWWRRLLHTLTGRWSL